MKRIKEETRHNLPERIALMFKLRKKDFVGKHSISFVCACKRSSISPALSILRSEGYQILMQWNRVGGFWSYNIQAPKK